MMTLSMVAPSSKEMKAPMTNSGLPADFQSIEATKLAEEYFPSDNGVPLFVVFSQDNKFTQEAITEYSKNLNDVLSQHPFRIIEFAQLPPVSQQSFISEDGNTFFVPTF